MRALSIRQPWAWLICTGLKDVENRSWRTLVRGRIYVHAPLSMASMDKFTLAALLRVASAKELAPLFAKYEKLPFGAIIGEVDIIACRRRVGILGDGNVSRWHELGQYGFYMENAALYDDPIPCKGRQGFFYPDLGGSNGQG